MTVIYANVTNWKYCVALFLFCYLFDSAEKNRPALHIQIPDGKDVYLGFRCFINQNKCSFKKKTKNKKRFYTKYDIQNISIYKLNLDLYMISVLDLIMYAM